MRASLELLSTAPQVPASSAARAAAPVVVPTTSAAMRADAMVGVEDLCVRFGDVVALDHVSFDVHAGEILCLLGPSGSGKSTLLRVLAGIERPADGCILIAGTEVAGPDTFVEPERRHVGMVFQDYALFPHLTVEANVAFGLRGRSRSDSRRIVTTLLERLGIGHYAASYPHMLSGGERQRVALARALAPEPRVLLLDEPFSGLDDRLRDRVRRETIDVLRDSRTTTIVVTHDPSEAMRIGDRLALLRDGRLLQIGAPDVVYERPASSFVARFLSEVNLLPAICGNGQVDTVFGRFPAASFPDGATVSVCIRPQHVHITAGPGGVPATVVLREFLGDGDRIVADVTGLDTPLLIRTTSRSGLVPGSAVFLRVDPSDVMVVLDDVG